MCQHARVLLALTLHALSWFSQLFFMLFMIWFHNCAMHYNAKCSAVQSCYHMSSVRPSLRLSVCPSMTLVDHDHIGWKSWKLIVQAISLTSSLFAVQRSPTYSQLGEHGEIWGRLEVGWEKVARWSTKVAISLKRVKIEEKLLWRAYRKSPMLFRMVPSATPYDLLFP